MEYPEGYEEDLVAMELVPWEVSVLNNPSLKFRVTRKLAPGEIPTIGTPYLHRVHTTTEDFLALTRISQVEKGCTIVMGESFSLANPMVTAAEYFGLSPDDDYSIWEIEIEEEHRLLGGAIV